MAFEVAEATEVPMALVAVTVNEYPPPAVRPLTVQEVSAEVQVKPPAVEVTVYEEIAAPPVEAGAVHDSVADPLPATATGLVGAPGTVAGVPETRFDDAPLPTELTARMVTL